MKELEEKIRNPFFYFWKSFHYSDEPYSSLKKSIVDCFSEVVGTLIGDFGSAGASLLSSFNHGGINMGGRDSRRATFTIV